MKNNSLKKLSILGLFGLLLTSCQNVNPTSGGSTTSSTTTSTSMTNTGSSSSTSSSTISSSTSSSGSETEKPISTQKITFNDFFDNMYLSKIKLANNIEVYERFYDEKNIVNYIFNKNGNHYDSLTYYTNITNGNIVYKEYAVYNSEDDKYYGYCVGDKNSDQDVVGKSLMKKPINYIYYLQKGDVALQTLIYSGYQESIRMVTDAAKSNYVINYYSNSNKEYVGTFPFLSNSEFEHINNPLNINYTFDSENNLISYFADYYELGVDSKFHIVEKAKMLEINYNGTKFELPTNVYDTPSFTETRTLYVDAKLDTTRINEKEFTADNALNLLPDVANDYRRADQFLGWYVDPWGKVKIDKYIIEMYDFGFDKSDLNSSQLYPIWERTYPRTFYPDGNGGFVEVPVEKNLITSDTTYFDYFASLYLKRPEGHFVKEWYYDKEYTRLVNNNDPLENDMIVYAKY